MTRAPTQVFLDRLAAELGPKGYTTDADTMAPWLTDWRGKYTGHAAAMLSPGSTEEVAAVVRLCAEEQAALVPQGGNSGMVGGATPDAGGNQLLLSLRRMNKVRQIDTAARIAVVEAGVILETFHHEALAHGLRTVSDIAANTNGLSTLITHQAYRPPQHATEQHRSQHQTGQRSKPETGNAHRAGRAESQPPAAEQANHPEAGDVYQHRHKGDLVAA